MDSGWAVILGAAIAFLGTIVGSAVQDWLADRRQRKALTRDETRAATQKVLALTLEHGTIGELADPKDVQDLADRAFLLSAELVMVAPPKEADIGSYVMAQWSRLARDTSHSSGVISTVLADMSSWSRGDVTAVNLCRERGIFLGSDN